jgi:hypothetical protein
MSNRFQERLQRLTGTSGSPSAVNITQWGSVAVAAAVTLADAMTNAALVPLIGSRGMGFNATDGWNRVRIGSVASTLFDLKIGGNEFARTVHLASAALPAAGAFTAQAAFAVSSGVGEIAFWVTYTRGAAGGFPIFHVLFGNGTEEGQDITVDATIVPTAPQGRQQFYMQELAGPIPAGAGAIDYVIPVRIPRGATTVRMLAAEAGVVGTPGTIAIALAGGTAR